MKSEGKDYLASMGIYIFNRELLVELIIQILKILGKKLSHKQLEIKKILSPIRRILTDIEILILFLKLISV
jgi:glucose-1-phosphate adenylyltransferase